MASKTDYEEVPIKINEYLKLPHKFKLLKFNKLETEIIISLPDHYQMTQYTGYITLKFVL